MRLTAGIGFTLRNSTADPFHPVHRVMVQGIETVALLERRQGSVKVGDIVEVLWRTTLDLFERLHDNDDKSTYHNAVSSRPPLALWASQGDCGLERCCMRARIRLNWSLSMAKWLLLVHRYERLRK